MQLDPAGPSSDGLVRLVSRPTCDTSEDVRLANIDSAIKRGLPALCRFAPPHGGRLLAVGGGPSLPRYLGDLQRQRKRPGRHLWCVNGTHDFLIRRGILPDACVLLDASPLVHKGVKPDRRVVYLVGSQCDPSTFDLLLDAGCDVRLWHAWNGDGIKHFLQAKQTAGEWMILGGGCTVTLRCLNVGYSLGFRDFRFYGLDSSVEGDRHHAYDDAEMYEDRIEVIAHGRKFWTNHNFAAQANDFNRMFGEMMDCRIEAIGDGLIPWMSQELNRQKVAA